MPSVLLIRRIVQLWYSRKEAHEGAYPLCSYYFHRPYRDTKKTLQHLLKKQRTKGEEIKKKTNYHSTHDLLSKYDESVSLNTPHPSQGLRQRSNPVLSQAPRAPNNVGNAAPPRPPASGSNEMNPGPPALIHPSLNALSRVYTHRHRFLPLTIQIQPHRSPVFTVRSTFSDYHLPSFDAFKLHAPTSL